MATHPEARQTSATRKLLRSIGAVTLVVGLVGVGVWAVKSFGASYSATIHEDSIVSEVVDLIWAPGTGEAGEETLLMVGMDQSGNVIWEGSEEEWGALRGEAESAYQADLRRIWLYPSIVIGVVGLLLVIPGRRRTT